MDESRNGGRTFHRVREPRLQWELGALTDTAGEYSQTSDNQQPVGNDLRLAFQIEPRVLPPLWIITTFSRPSPSVTMWPCVSRTIWNSPGVPNSSGEVFANRKVPK